ncbi:hypothetical protein [Streptomyces sp. bgisy100]|uniref:hypothetical protein n=1 Tax=Streptomyces sp. bgisy100 TaxID=3413783 RepID=UPI003D718575
MARKTTSTNRRTARHTLRREVPGTVALLADPGDFAAMRRYPGFAFADHPTYLREMEALLRELAAEGLHTSVALFDPEEYEGFCAEAGLDPARPDSRVRYTAMASGGATVPYRGQPVDRLVPEVVAEAERHATFTWATALLAAADGCAHCDRGAGRAAYARASRAVTGLLEAVGPGDHHLVCSVPADGASLIAVCQAECEEEGRVRVLESEALILCTVLAAGIATGSRGGIVVRSSAPAPRDAPGRDVVRGWALRDGWPRPLTEAEVFAAYCTDADTGEPVPPEHGVEYRPGIPLPPPEDDR